MTSWKDLGIKDDIISVIENKLKFPSPTKVQTECIPQFLKHKDVIVQAPTGSGKTLGFVVPVLEILRRREERWKPFEIGALILVPTKELTQQIVDVFKVFFDELKFNYKLISFISNGKATADIKRFEKNGGNIVIATPVRFEQVFNHASSSLRGHLGSLEVLIMDEADRLMDWTWESRLTAIFSNLPKQRRTGLFSATQTKTLEQLAKTGLRNPQPITVYEQTLFGDAKSNTVESENGTGGAVLPATLQNYYTIVKPEEKLTALMSFLRAHKKEKILVFYSTCACVDYFGQFLKQTLTKLNITTIHGKLKKRRTKVFDTFRQQESGVLICTDVMSRGIDLPDVNWVIQMDLPRQTSWFAHRCGRTARAGKEGNSMLILMPEEERYVRFLQKNQKITLKEQKIEFTPEKVEDTFNELRTLNSTVREMLEKGTKAYVTYFQSYNKHDCHIVCNVKHLNAVSCAHGFGLLRLPKMPDLATRDLSGFRRCDVNTADIPYKNPVKEARRQEQLKERRAYLSGNAKKRTPAQKPTNQVNRKRRHDKDDLDELNSDYKLLKRFKKGKISKKKFNEVFD